MRRWAAVAGPLRAPGMALRPLPWLALWLSLWPAAWATGCSPAPAVRTEAVSLRRGLEDAIGALEPAEPLRLRYNPAPCDCPAFELHMAGLWVRADLQPGELPTFEPWARRLVDTPIEALPVEVQLLGRVDRELLRTVAGAYAVRVEVQQLIAPAPPEPAAP